MTTKRLLAEIVMVPAALRFSLLGADFDTYFWYPNQSVGILSCPRPPHQFPAAVKSLDDPSMSNYLI